MSSLVPIVLGLLGISVIHDAPHQIAASRSDVKIGLPVPLPSYQIGTFGSITPLRSSNCIILLQTTIISVIDLSTVSLCPAAL